VAGGEEARTLRSRVGDAMRADPVDRVALVRRVAERVVAAGGYPV
jgi:hypothetical protein